MKQSRTIIFLLLVLLIAGASFAFAQSATPTPLPAAPGDSLQEIELSGWVKKESKLGNTSFAKGDFYMSAKHNGFFYVLVAPEDYTSRAMITHVTLRNVTGRPTNLGYGMVLHSDPEPLVKGYAFLIDTVKKRYRVVRHASGEEYPVVRWTNSTHINGGKADNTLEAVDKGSETDLFINHKFVTSIKNTYAHDNGDPGLYTGGFLKIAFKGLSISKNVN